MKKELILLMLLLVSVKAVSQDTIFVKSGEVIPAVIISKDNTEIKYKKFSQKESAAIYSVFVSDVKSIHYSDGIVADYTETQVLSKGPKRPVELAPMMGIGKLSIGMSANRFSRSTSDELTKFWQVNPFLKNTTPVSSNPGYYALELRMNMVMGRSLRNWIGTGLELIFTPDDAIYANSTDGRDEINLHGFYYNIPLYYGHTINHKKNLIAIFEPALNLAFFSGNIKVDGDDGKISSNLGTGMNLAFGVDWLFSKRFHVSLRAGQRFLKIKESHKDETSSSGYSSYYTNPPDKDFLTIKVNGPYVSAGLYWSMYYKMKGFRME
ncbi:MAG TPA: hypothetical protein VK155_12760 [Bacteroidales bacterium]|jgi:hypothetical protein|nr:hypothetical protein [Bacteroidales bacterium]